MTSALLGTALPIVAAPMAGGSSTVTLARAVAAAGGFPFLAAGYKTPEKLSSEIDELRGSVARFGVNLFVPSNAPVDAAAFAAYAAELHEEAAAYDIELDPVPTNDDDAWNAKLALLLASPVPVVSVTFGLPDSGDVTALQEVGTRVLATVTTVGEARNARQIGVDGLVVQGPRAGGHSGTHDPSRDIPDIPTADLVRQIRGAVDLPVIAAGGVDGSEAVRELLAAGAEGVAVGTLLLRTDEAGTSPTHRRALSDTAFTDTILTRVFTGRPARALRNGFIDRHQSAAIDAYPAVHHLTGALRRSAGKAGDADRLHLWAGTGWRNAPTGPVADVIRQLAVGL